MHVVLHMYICILGMYTYVDLSTQNMHYIHTCVYDRRQYWWTLTM